MLDALCQTSVCRETEPVDVNVSLHEGRRRQRHRADV